MRYHAISALLRAGRPDLANLVAYEVLAAKQLYFHGTSTVFAKRILSEGFVPDPKRKVWDPERGRLASYQGTYFSRNFGTASGAAQNAAIKFGGRQCVFEVQLETRTALMDEDNLPNMRDALMIAAGRYYILQSIYDKATDKWSADRGRQENAEFLASQPASNMVDKAADIVVEDFERKMHEHLKLAHQQADRLREAAKRWAWALLNAAAEGLEVHRQSSAETAEIRAAKNDFMRAAGSVAKQRESFMGNNARVLEPVTFRGANRILSAIVNPQYYDPIYLEYKDRNEYPVYVVYGKPSSTMVSGMKSWSANIKLIPMSLSRIPNVFDPYHKREKMAAHVKDCAV